MDFSQVEAEFHKLKGQYDAGALTEAEFKAELEKLMFQDEQGRWWMIGYETGRWHYHDGQTWVRAEPPRVAVPASPAPPVTKPLEVQPVPTRRDNKALWIGAIGALALLVVFVVRSVLPGPTPMPTSTPTLPPRAMEPTATLSSVAPAPTKTLVPPTATGSTAVATETATPQATQTTALQETRTAVAYMTSTAIAAGTATAHAAETASAQATSTAVVQVTSTAVAARTATALAIKPQPTNTRTPSPYKYPVPRLSTPAKGAVFTGYIVMDFGWEPVAQQLAADDYYVLVITFQHKDGHRYPYLQASTKDTRWQGRLNAFLYDSDVLAGRASGWQHGWYVVVMRNPGTNEKGQITGTELSQRSEERFFTWKLEGAVPGGPGATPTRTPKV